MWQKLQEDPPYFLKTTRENAFEINVTNYITIWYVNFSNESFSTCLQDSNIDLEVERNELAQKGIDLLLNPTGLSSLVITKGPSTLEVSMTKLFEYPLAIKLKLIEGSKEMFFQKVPQMPVRNMELKFNQQQLIDLLKKKNDQTEECIHEERILSNIKTENYNCKHQGFKQNEEQPYMLNTLDEGTSSMANKVVKLKVPENFQFGLELQTPTESEPQSLAFSSELKQELELEVLSNSETSSDSECELSSETDCAQDRNRERRSLNRASIQNSSECERYRSRSPLRTATNSDEPQVTMASTSQGIQQQPFDRSHYTKFIWKSDSPRKKTNTHFSDTFSGVPKECNLNVTSTELAFFEHFLDENLVQQIVYCTNMHHKFFVLKSPPSKHSRLSLWKELTVSEMYVFLAVTMLMTRNKHLTIEEHWSTDIMLSSQIFSNIMTRNRYCMILAMLSFSEPGSCNPKDPRLHILRFLINYTRKKFRESFIPYSDLCVHNSKVPFKGRLDSKQNKVEKETRFGMELFVLCDVKTNYILDFILHCHSASEIDAELGVGGSVVMSLMMDYFGTHRKVYTGDRCTSPILYKTLLDNGIYACGTVNARKVGMPSFKDLQKGEVHAKYSEGLLALKWTNKKDGHMLSSWHDSTVRSSQKSGKKTGSAVIKPECYYDYKRKMMPADNTDMLMSSLQCIWKTVTWYKKFALHIFDMQLQNAFYAYKNINKQNCQLSRFQLAVIRQIILKHKSNIVLDAVPKSTLQCNVQRKNRNPLRILPGNTAEHMPKYIPGKKYMRCKVCAIHKQRRATRYYCSVCQAYLCVVPCFQVYHQKL